MFLPSSRFDSYVIWPTSVNTWPWPFKVMLYIFRCVLTRETRWCQNRCSITSNTEVIIEKLFRSKMPFFDVSWLLTPKRLILGEIWRHLSEKKNVSRAFYGFFKFWRSSYRDRDNADNMKPCHVIPKFWKTCLWWPLVTSILTSYKNDLSTFARAC